MNKILHNAKINQDINLIIPTLKNTKSSQKNYNLMAKII